LPASPLLASAVVLVLAVAGGAWLLRPRPATAQPARGVVVVPAQPAPGGSGASPALPARSSSAASPGPTQANKPNSQAQLAAQRNGTITPLTAAEPSEIQIRRLLESWLATKTRVLAGAGLPANLEVIAREGMVERLASERRQDAASGVLQTIEVSIADLAISERTPGRIAVITRLRYSDSQRDAAGKVVGSTPSTTLRNVYVFGRDGDRWRLAASHTAD
jgi:hypothetical protein